MASFDQDTTVRLRPAGTPQRTRQTVGLWRQFRDQPGHQRVRSAAISVAAGCPTVLLILEAIAHRVPTASVSTSLRAACMTLTAAAVLVLLQVYLARSVGTQVDTQTRAWLAQAEVHARLARGPEQHAGHLAEHACRLNQLEQAVVSMEGQLNRNVIEIGTEVHAIKEAIHLVAGPEGARIVPIRRTPRDL